MISYIVAANPIIYDASVIYQTLVGNITVALLLYEDMVFEWY